MVVAAMAGIIAMLSTPAQAQAQAIFVNSVSCPAASVQFSSTGMVAILPPGCAGNGNPCDSVTVTFSPTAIYIAATAACLTASPIAVPTALQTVSVNDNSCFGATVTWSSTGIAISAPLACLGGASPTPVIGSINPAITYAGQIATVTGANFAAGATITIGGVAAAVLGSTGATSLVVGIPVVGIGTQPVVVTAAGQPSAAFPVTIIAVPIFGALRLTAVQSRKSHGALGPFDLAINTVATIGGLVTVEPRMIGSGHVMVFQFDGAVTATGTVSAVDANGLPVNVNAQRAGYEIAVSLANVADKQRITVSLNGVNGTTNASASVGFLLGDVNNSRAVNSSDITAVKVRSNELTNITNFRFDVNTSGFIDASDVSIVKGRSGSTLQ